MMIHLSTTLNALNALNNMINKSVGNLAIYIYTPSGKLT